MRALESGAVELHPTPVCVFEVLQSVLLEVVQNLPPGIKVRRTTCVSAVCHWKPRACLILSFCRSVMLS